MSISSNIPWFICLLAGVLNALAIPRIAWQPRAWLRRRRALVVPPRPIDTRIPPGPDRVMTRMTPTDLVTHLRDRVVLIALMEQRLREVEGQRARAAAATAAGFSGRRPMPTS